MSRAVWWLLVAGNVLFLIVALIRGYWGAAPIILIGLALLFAPASRRYVFERNRESSRISDNESGGGVPGAGPSK